MAIILLTICTAAAFDLAAGATAAELMVDGVMEYVYRLRPIVEWTGYTPRQYMLREFLLPLMPHLNHFHMVHHRDIA